MMSKPVDMRLVRPSWSSRSLAKRYYPVGPTTPITWFLLWTIAQFDGQVQGVYDLWQQYFNYRLGLMQVLHGRCMTAIYGTLP